MDKQRLASLLIDLMLSAQSSDSSIGVVETVSRVLTNVVAAEDPSAVLEAAAKALSYGGGKKAYQLTSLVERSDAVAALQGVELLRRDREAKLAALLLRRVAQIMLIVVANGAKQGDR